MREQFATQLTPCFNLEAPTKYDLRIKKQSEWPFWRKVLDKLVVVGAAIGIAGSLLFGFAFGSFLGWPESIPVGAFMFIGLIPSIIIVTAICRSARRKNYESWRKRLS